MQNSDWSFVFSPHTPFYGFTRWPRWDGSDAHSCTRRREFCDYVSAAARSYIEHSIALSHHYGDSPACHHSSGIQLKTNRLAQFAHLWWWQLTRANWKPSSLCSLREPMRQWSLRACFTSLTPRMLYLFFWILCGVDRFSLPLSYLTLPLQQKHDCIRDRCCCGPHEHFNAFTFCFWSLIEPDCLHLNMTEGYRL